MGWWPAGLFLLLPPPQDVTRALEPKEEDLKGQQSWSRVMVWMDDALHAPEADLPGSRGSHPGLRLLWQCCGWNSHLERGEST